MRKKMVAAVSAALLSVVAPASAQNLKNGYDVESRFYWSNEGFYQRTTLPNFDVGFRHLAGDAITDRGQAHAHHPRLDGAGGTFGIGYTPPERLWLPVFGNVDALEWIASYTKGKGQSFDASPYGSGLNNTSLLRLVMLNGRVIIPNVGGCVGGSVNCQTFSTLSSSFQTGEIELKMVRNEHHSAVDIANFVSLIGRASEINQSLFQTKPDEGPRFQYWVASSIDWIDAGIKTGFKLSLNATENLALVLKSSAALVVRSVALKAEDLSGGGNSAFVNVSSRIDRSAVTLPILADTEIGLAIKLSSKAQLYAFASASLDTKVPALSAANYNFCAPAGGPIDIDFCGNGAGIKFAFEPTYRVGANISINF